MPFQLSEAKNALERKPYVVHSFAIAQLLPVYQIVKRYAIRTRAKEDSNLGHKADQLLHHMSFNTHIRWASTKIL